MSIIQELKELLLSLDFKESSNANVFILDDQLVIIPKKLTKGYLLAIKKYLEFNDLIDEKTINKIDHWVIDLKEE